MITGTSLGRRPDLLVVGGGIAGLSAATIAAQAGRSVVLLERLSAVGGRGMTHVRDGVHFNQGAHALYCKGHAADLLRRLGVSISGHFPNPGRAIFFGAKGSVDPTRNESLLTTGLFTLREKWRLIRFFAGLGRIDAHSFDRVSLGDWMRRTAGGGNLADFLRALFRVTTYVEDPEHLSAGAALKQLQTAYVGNVWYLDGGWQTVVDGLRRIAEQYGVEIRTGARVQSVSSDATGVLASLADGTNHFAGAAVLAVGPDIACEILGLASESPLAAWAARCRPVRAACLDLALSQLPQPARRFAMGLDKPTYFSVHSAAAKLAPDGTAVVHILKYLSPDSEDRASTETELEEFLDVVQPGWRAHVLQRRFLPSMLVAHTVPLAEYGGTAGRPTVGAAGLANVFLAGDWVGTEGMLADSSAASAEQAARAALGALERMTSSQSRSLSHAGR
jgi:phytoene dehydrogenase-like protein